MAPESPERTARAFAAAIDRHLSNPPPVLTTPRRSNTSFENELLAAYDMAFQAGRDHDHRPTMGWAFPAGKPQVFADNPRALSKGVMVYGFGRRLPRWTQRGLALGVRVPILRRLVAESTLGHVPVCGWTTWRAVRGELCHRNAQSSLDWIHFQSQWGKNRSSMLGLDRRGTIQWFVVVEPKEKDDFRRRVPSTRSFRIAACVDSFVYDAWSVRQFEPLPRFHRPARWNSARIRRVAEDVSLALNGVLPPAVGIPPHWRPIHGDYVPWNLREDSSGQLWLIDWEDTGWGPPLADFVRYIVAYHSLSRWHSPARIADIVIRTVGAESLDVLLEVATFWLSHPNLQLSTNDRAFTPREGRDTARQARDAAAFHALALVVEESTQTRAMP